jgi:hypothetical protein
MQSLVYIAGIFIFLKNIILIFDCNNFSPAFQQTKDCANQIPFATTNQTESQLLADRKNVLTHECCKLKYKDIGP